MPTLPVIITAGAPARGAGTQADITFHAQSLAATFAWGSSPGTATIVYIGNAPVTAGALMRIELGNHLFFGLCKSDTVKVGSDGTTRTLEFVDLREYLTWDIVFCAFNKPDSRLIEGVRVKRYKHLYPRNAANWIWTYSDSPLTAFEILDAIMQGPTIGSPWRYEAHNFLNVP